MAKYELKTKKNTASVKEFLVSIKDPVRRNDANRLLAIMKEVTGQKAVMWGGSIVGFGSYHYVYKSGQEGDWPATGFSPRKTSLTIYVMPHVNKFGSLLKELGPHKTSVSCLYIKRLDDIDIPTLKEIIKKGYSDITKLYPPKK